MRYSQTSTYRLNSRFYLQSLISLSLLLFSVLTSNAQSADWTWVHGDNTVNQTGVYGTKGVADAANKPGARYNNSQAIDAAGNYWIFGGRTSTSAAFSDLWMYKPTTNQWTWINGDNTMNVWGIYGTKGVANAANKPGGRYGHVSWFDASGNFWVFGGTGYDNAGGNNRLNDLWKYTPGTGLWTWMGGDNVVSQLGIYGAKGTAAAANKPGARAFCAEWADGAGNIWIFGGLGFASTGVNGSLNDLWKYNISTSEWTWVSGDNIRNVTGIYGTKGTPDAANKPGGRNDHQGWMDAAGNFWIFGGAGRDISGLAGRLNDLWKYNPLTEEWTWIAGDANRDQVGVYGTKGVADAANKPGGRAGHAVVVDAAGNFWLFGGSGYSDVAFGELSDLWVFKPATGEWTWKNGANSVSSTAVYGTKGTGATTNTPGKRWYPAVWVDATGKLWLFGGSNGTDALNDVWQLNSLITLPLRHINLQATIHNNNNILYWETAGEENTGKFIVERSTNGTDYSAVGTVAAAGTGNNRYSFTDYNIAPAKYFYRLQVNDRDGQTYYSKVAILDNTAGARIYTYPNPARTGLTLQITDISLLQTYAQLYNAGGVLIKQVLINSQQQYIEVQQLPIGTYAIRLANGKACSFIKE